jgi:acetate kinase
MNILVINSGSSSIKYQLFENLSTNPICSGLVDRIGQANACITHKIYVGGEERVIALCLELADHQASMEQVGKLLTELEIGVIRRPEDIQVVGHRIVHGGENLAKTTIITARVKEEIKRLFPLAPLHNPGHYQGILVAEKLFKKAVHIAVFDTAFHQTLPEKAFRYAIPESYYTTHGVRVYGFHGISHKYVADKASKYLNNPDAKMISIHLGNGCSMAAIRSGKCVDTSMGLTPLDGLIMGTRCGNIDPSVILYLISELGFNVKQLNEMLNKQSGMLGLTGYSDMRDIIKLMENEDQRAKLAYDMYAYRIKKYIGSYAAVLNGLDAIIFTAGIGENDQLMREMVCSEMDFLGISIDGDKNESTANSLREISAVDSLVKVLVIPTNEEFEIASQCIELLTENSTQDLF